MTSDFDAVKAGIDRANASGGTNLQAGISIENNELITKSTEDRIKVIIALSGGDSLHWERTGCTPQFMDNPEIEYVDDGEEYEDLFE